MNQTANYQLCQWDPTDRILMEDFNSDNSKVDAALKAQADTLESLSQKAGGRLLGTLKASASGTTCEFRLDGVDWSAWREVHLVADPYTDTRAAALEAAAGGFGNCQIYCDTYTGTGSGATSVTFPQKPLFVFITGTTERVSMALARDAATAFSYNGNYSLNVDVSWTENGVTVTQPDNNMSYQCNLIGKTYLVLALVAMEA